MRRARNYKKEQQEHVDFLWAMASDETKEKFSTKLKDGLLKAYDECVKKGLIIPDNIEEE